MIELDQVHRTWGADHDHGSGPISAVDEIYSPPPQCKFGVRRATAPVLNPHRNDHCDPVTQAPTRVAIRLLYLSVIEQ
jgi:hypothetical protein